MRKLLVLFIAVFPLTSLAQIADCDPSEKTVLQKFQPIPFGKLARNILETEAQEIIKLISDFKINNPKVEVVRLDVLVCTSAYPLPPISITDKNDNEHIDLALQRAMKIKKDLNKQSIPAEVAHKVCGPAFVPTDKNWRIVVKGKTPQNIYDQAYADIGNTAGILEQYKNEALIESFDEVKAQYPEPFLAKYKPFQGYRINLVGKEICSSNNHKIKAGKEEAEGAKKE
jgi:hypothetical protein